MICYAIRSKEHGGYFPQMRNGRGMTSKTPINPRLFTVIPRLFKSRHAANCALNAWAKGEWVRVYRKGDWSFGEDDEDYLKIEPRGREKEDMEIVEIDIPMVGERRTG